MTLFENNKFYYSNLKIDGCSRIILRLSVTRMPYTWPTSYISSVLSPLREDRLTRIFRFQIFSTSISNCLVRFSDMSTGTQYVAWSNACAVLLSYSTRPRKMTTSMMQKYNTQYRSSKQD